MRTNLVVLAAAAALAFAGTAQAGTIEIIWQGSGTATTSAAPSASITADIFLIVTESDVQSVVWSIEWDLDLGDELDFVSSSCDGSGTLCLLGQGSGDQESSYGFGVSPPSTLATGTYTAGTITFHVTANVATDGVDVVPTFNNSPAGDGCGTSGGGAGACNGTTNLVGASVNVVPEPSTVALLTLGLAGLGLVGHRSRR